MSAQVRRAALDVVAADFAANVSGMAGRVFPVARDAFRDAVSPSVQLVPLRTRREWTRPQGIAVVGDHRGLFRVGREVTTLQIRVVERTPKAREPIEEGVEARFSAGARPRLATGAGTLSVTTGPLTLLSVATGYSAPADVALSSSIWVEEKTNEHRRYSYLDTTLTTEMLYLGPVGSGYFMNSIVLHVAADDLHTPAEDVATKNYQITASGPVRLP